MKAKKPFLCFIGLHEWYYGNFSSPVYGRSERHCLNCDKKQYREYKPLRWINF